MAIDGINTALVNPALNLPRAGQAAASAASAADAALSTRQQGIVDRTALQTALTSTVVPTSKTAPDPTLAQALDRNGDGKVTPDELTAQTQSLADSLFGNLRQTGGAAVPVTPTTQAATLKPPGQLSSASPSQSETEARIGLNAGARAVANESPTQLGNPGRVMALMNLVDLASSYGPNGQATVPTLTGGKNLDVSA